MYNQFDRAKKGEIIIRVVEFVNLHKVYRRIGLEDDSSEIRLIGSKNDSGIILNQEILLKLMVFWISFMSFEMMSNIHGNFCMKNNLINKIRL